VVTSASRAIAVVASVILAASATTAPARAEGVSPAAGAPASPLEQPKVPGVGPERLGVLFGAGFLASPGGSGGAVSGGLRLRLGEHFAGSFDLGYGVLQLGTVTQDRWWAIPSIAVVASWGHVRFDIGAGAGVGTASGYSSWSSYTAGPFTPDWHATVPAGRLYALAATPLARDLYGFVRADVATLWVGGSGSTHADPRDSSWVLLWFGVETRVL
jgi:hypothetical protein